MKKRTLVIAQGAGELDTGTVMKLRKSGLPESLLHAGVLP